MTNRRKEWVKCRKPEEWICDVCGKCGGVCCGFLEMWHRGDEARCATHKDEKA